MRLAIVKDGVVVNTTVVPEDWDGRDGQWSAPQDAEAVPSDTAAIGWVRDGGDLRPPAPTFDLAAAIARARREIDTAAEAARLTWITPGSGQAMVYQVKQQEAEDLVGRGGGEAADYPLLAASIGIEGDSVAEIAAVVLQVRSQWVTLAATIERARLGAKRDLDALEAGATQDDVDAIVAGTAFPRSEEA